MEQDLIQQKSNKYGLQPGVGIETIHIGCNLGDVLPGQIEDACPAHGVYTVAVGAVVCSSKLSVVVNIHIQSVNEARADSTSYM